MTSSQPLVEVRFDKRIVIQVRIGAADTVDFLTLAGAERFVRIEAPDAFEQALSSQHFMKARNATGVVVSGVEEGGVAISDFNGAPEKFDGNRRAARRDATTFGVKLDGALSPDRPMPEQSASDTTLHRFTADGETYGVVRSSTMLSSLPV